MMNIESTKDNRVWHKGPPPHIGWWNVSNGHTETLWRWWDGEYWSIVVRESDRLSTVAHCGSIANQLPGDLMWSDYWPENAVCPRLDPGQSPTVWNGRLWAWIDGELVNNHNTVFEMAEFKTVVCPDHKFVNAQAVKNELNTLSMAVLRLDAALDRLKEILK